MIYKFNGPKSKIVAGVKTPIDDKFFLSSLMSFAQRSKMSIQACEAVDPWISPATIYPGEYLFYEAAQAAEESNLETKENTLSELFKPYREVNYIETEAMIGKPADVLRTAATSKNAKLIICGVKRSSSAFIPNGFSTALSLMSHSPKPVLLIPHDEKFDFSKKDLKILVSDNLRENSSNLITSLGNLACKLEACKLIHFHCYSQSKDDLRSWIDLISISLANRDPKENIPLPESHESIIDRTSQTILNKLKERFQLSEKRMDESGLLYEPQMSFGKVFEELSQIVEREQPDILAFGSHHFFDGGPATLGKLPFYAMLGFGLPVLIVPEQST